MTMAETPAADLGRDVPLGQRTGSEVTTTSAGWGVLAPYQNAVNVAAQTKKQAADQILQLQRTLATTPETTGGVATAEGGTFGEKPNPAYKAAQDQLIRAMSLYDSAAREHQKALDSLADATAKEAAKAEPAYRATMQAAADKARTDADRAADDYKEWSAAAPDRKAAVVANQRLSSIQADQLQLQLDLARETRPEQRSLIQQQVAANGIALQQAQADANVATRTQGSRVTQATEAAAQAGIQTQTAQANLDDLLRRIRQAPSDEDARQALQQALAQGKASIAATGASTAATQASTKQTEETIAAGKQGTLYGLEDYIKQQKDAIAKGLITSDQADQALQARISGTDVFSAAKAANDAEMARTNQQISQRAEETNLAGTKAGIYGSMANTGLSQFTELNKTVPPGSDVAGRGLIGWLTGAQQTLAQPQFNAPPRIASPALPPMLQSFVAQPQTQATPQGAGSVTINIGGHPQQAQSMPFSGPAPTPQPMPFSGATPPMENMTQQPALLDAMRPASPDDVARVWGAPQQANTSNTAPPQRGPLF